jgi:hypothetical protein
LAVGVAASAKLFAAGASWRLVGLPTAGRSLLTAVATGGETEKTLAGMFLVQAGDRSVPLLSSAIQAGGTDRALVDVLASIGSDEARDALVTIAQGTQATVTPQTREAAVEALHTLDAIRDRGSGSA